MNTMVTSTFPTADGSARFNRQPLLARQLTFSRHTDPDRFLRVPGEVRMASRRLLLESGYPDLVDRAVLVVSELATNAIKYGVGNITVRFFAADPASLWISVQDEGAHVPSLKLADVDDESGRGLAIVDAVADLMVVGAGRVSVALHRTHLHDPVPIAAPPLRHLPSMTPQATQSASVQGYALLAALRWGSRSDKDRAVAVLTALVNNAVEHGGEVVRFRMVRAEDGALLVEVFDSQPDFANFGQVVCRGHGSLSQVLPRFGATLAYAPSDLGKRVQARLQQPEAA
ncbi:ATP-binding protein [Streptomyces sp. NPDC002690]